MRTLLCVVLLSCSALAADSKSGAKSDTQSDENGGGFELDGPFRKGSSEWGLSSGGAIGTHGGARYKGFWNIQLHWGRILTDVHGYGLLGGTLEYLIEAQPIAVIRQSSVAVGAGVNPMVLQYHFGRGHRLIPFVLAGAGLLVTGQQVPEMTSKFNFTPQAGFGFDLLRHHGTSITTGVRFHHVSNGGFSRPNPGHNSFYFYSGFSWWR